MYLAQIAPISYQPPTTKQSESTSLLPMITETLQEIPTDLLDKLDYTRLAKKLEPMQGMEKQTEIFQDLGRNLQDQAQNLSQTDRDNADYLYAKLLDPMREVSLLEDAGSRKEARELFTKNIAAILEDDRVKGNKSLHQFFKSLSEYRFGSGKFIYSMTMYGKKARDQKSPELATQTQHHDAMEQISDRQAMISMLKSGKPNTFTAGDANTLFKSSVRFHGGNFSETGEMVNVHPDIAQNIQDLAELSAIYYARGIALTHEDAVIDAAQKLDMGSIL
jgi:hypothetical protein